MIPYAVSTVSSMPIKSHNKIIQYKLSSEVYDILINMPRAFLLKRRGKVLDKSVMGYPIG